MDQRALFGMIFLLFLLLLFFLFFLRTSYYTGVEVPDCDAPVVLDQLRNNGLIASSSTASSSIESVALDHSIGRRICLLKPREIAVDKGEVKFVVAITDRLPSLLRVKVISD
jgi:hypothetical protein